MSTVKILLVDDDEDDFILTKDMLRDIVSSQDYSLTWCNNFSEAINAMLISHYDIYLVDYRFGRNLGIDLLNEAIKSNCAEPIIILTSKADFKIDQEIMRLGAADYLLKDTLSSQTLERSIRYAIAQNGALRKLKISESKFRIIFERSMDPMLVTNQAGQIIEANPAASKFFEIDLQEFVKMNAANLFKNKQDQLAYIASMDAKESITDLEVEMITISGKTKHCSISSFIQASQYADEKTYYSIIQDLTFNRLNQGENLSAETLLGTEGIMKSFSNEIKIPLSTINLAIDKLSDSFKNEDDLILAEIIKNSCKKIKTLTTALIEGKETSSL